MDKFVVDNGEAMKPDLAGIQVVTVFTQFVPFTDSNNEIMIWRAHIQCCFGYVLCCLLLEGRATSWTG